MNTLLFSPSLVLADLSTRWRRNVPSDKKFKNGNHIALSENNGIINDQHRVAEMFNDYFSTVSMGIGFDDNVTSATDAINKHSSHPSVLKIRGNRNPEHSFSFQLVDTQQVSLALKKSKPAKSDRIWQPSWKDNPHRIFRTVISSHTFDKHFNIPEIFPFNDEVRWN